MIDPGAYPPSHRLDPGDGAERGLCGGGVKEDSRNRKNVCNATYSY